MDPFERVPKVELHLHLEGSIPVEALWQLIQKYGGDPAVPDVAALRRRFEYRDFHHFLDTWIWKNQYLREYEDFRLIAEAVAADLARQNIRYVEAFYSPADFSQHGLEVGPITEAIRAGVDRVREIEVNLVADFVRDYGPQRAARTLDQLVEVRELGVIGVGIGGNESAHPPEPFAQVFHDARRAGFHVTCHAGEAAGPESVWGAVRALGAERIGHATRAVEDDALVDYLLENQIALEMCPISNLRTGVVGAIEEHPVRRFFERGLIVTVNTDDPKMFGNSLADEYRLLQERLGFSDEEIRQLIVGGIRASWLSDDRKQALEAEFAADPAWLA